MIPAKEFRKGTQAILDFILNDSSKTNLGHLDSDSDIDLSDCGLKEIPTFLFANPNAVSLNLSGNSLTDFEAICKFIESHPKLSQLK